MPKGVVIFTSNPRVTSSNSPEKRSRKDGNISGTKLGGLNKDSSNKSDEHKIYKFKNTEIQI